MDYYDAESYEVPDSDAKIYMSLDDIIKLEGIRKPGSIRSVASRRSTYSRKSNRSTYSNKSNRSYRSNYSNRSHRSQRSTCSNRSQSGYNRGTQLLRQRGGFVQRIGGALNGYQYKYLKKPGIYNPNSRYPFRYYRHAVRNAVKTLTGRVAKPNLVRMRRMGAYSYQHRKFLRNMEFDITVQIDNSRNNTPLTRKHLALFNSLQKNVIPRYTGTYKSSNCSVGSRYKRHSLYHSFNKRVQKEIFTVQQKAKARGERGDFSNMEYSPSPHVTSQSVNNRFTSYD